MSVLPLKDLIDHTSAISQDHTLRSAFELFRQDDHEFIAILDEEKFVGLCSRKDLGMLLGSQYGFSLHSNQPVSTCVRLNPIQLIDGCDVDEAFELVFSRCADSFYDDVVVLDQQCNFLGLIFTHTLVRLQNHYHREAISLLRHQTHAIEIQNRRLQADIELCGELQNAFLTERFPEVPLPGRVGRNAFRFSHYYKTHRVVGGDFFHVQRLDEHRVGVLIADVMGHNIRAALVTAMMRAMMEELGHKHQDPGVLLMEMNRRLYEIIGGAEHEVVYATACYLVMDASTLQCAYATAAHPSPIWISPTAGTIATIQNHEAGTVLGVFESSTYKTMGFSLSMGDMLLLYTDGIVEAENSHSKFWGVEGVMASLERSQRERDQSKVMQSLVNDAMEHINPEGFDDDVCLLLVGVGGDLEE